MTPVAMWRIYVGWVMARALATCALIGTEPVWVAHVVFVVTCVDAGAALSMLLRARPTAKPPMLGPRGDSRIWYCQNYDCAAVHFAAALQACPECGCDVRPMPPGVDL